MKSSDFRLYMSNINNRFDLHLPSISFINIEVVLTLTLKQKHKISIYKTVHQHRFYLLLSLV